MNAPDRDLSGRGPAFARAYPILAVDDELDNLLVLRATFRDEFTVYTENSPDEALRSMVARPVAILLTDQRMPGMTGIDLCERVRDLYPDVQRMLITAYSDREVAIAAINRGGVSRYIHKPWDAEQVRQILRDSVARAHLERMVRRLRLAMLDRERFAGPHAANARLLQDLARTNSSLSACCQRLEELRPRLAGELEPSVWYRYDREIVELRRYIDYVGALQSRSVAVDGGVTRPQRALISVEDHIDTVVELVRHELVGVARLAVECPAPAAVWADATDVSRILIHLVRSSAAALRRDGTATGNIAVTVSAEGGSTAIVVADDGGHGDSTSQRALLAGGSTDARAPGLEAALELTLANGGELDAIAPESPGWTAWQLILPAIEPHGPQPSWASASATPTGEGPTSAGRDEVP